MKQTNAVIVVVDDNVSVRTSLKRLLRSMGFQVKTYISAMEYLDNGSHHDCGCLIVDVRMPEMGGLDLQKRLADSGTLPPVIFITAFEDHGVRSQAMRAGARAFLQTPFSDQALMEAIYLALESGSQQLSGDMI